MSGQILILGSKGMLGGQLRRTFSKALGWDRHDIDITQNENLQQKLEELSVKPSVVINCASYNSVDLAEKQKDLAFKLNAEAVENLARICNNLGAVLVHFSTNYVFDGVKGEYEENDMPHPLSVYGESKLAGERAVQKISNKFYLIRTAVLFGPPGESDLSKKSFVQIMLDLSKKGSAIKAVDDEVNSLTYIVDLAEAVKDLILENKPYGIYHITNSGAASWFTFAQEIFKILEKDVKLEPVSAKALPRQAQRPAKALLINTKLPLLRPWQAALREFLISN